MTSKHVKIFDCSCFYGPWPEYPVRGAIAEVAAELRSLGITDALISPLAAVWCRNQQAYNRELLEITRPYSGMHPAPVLDPTLPAWQEEAARMLQDPRVKIFRMFLNYTTFSRARRDSLADFLADCSRSGIPLIAQRRMEDPRYNHCRADVPDTDMNHILDIAAELPGLKLILGGMSSGVSAARILNHPGIYLDTSQMDGLHCMRRQIEQGLLPRLLFGSHIPLFETQAAFGRVLYDVSDAEAERIFYSNAAGLPWLASPVSRGNCQ